MRKMKMPKVFYGSRISATKAKLDASCLMLGMTNEVDAPRPGESGECPNKAIIEYHRIPFQLMEPDGPSGSFAKMDSQARVIGEYIKPLLDGEKDVFVHCEYGEMRSVAVSHAIFLSGNYELISSYEDFVANKSSTPIPRLPTQLSRTLSIIHDILSDE